MKTTDNGNIWDLGIALVMIIVSIVVLVDFYLLPGEAEVCNEEVVEISVEETGMFSDEFANALAEYTEQYWLNYLNDHPYYNVKSN